MKADALLLLLALIPALGGTLYHIVPFLVTRFIARFFQTSGRSSVALSRLLVGLPIYTAWYVLVGWWAIKRLPPWLIGALLAVLPLCGVMALAYWRRARVNLRHFLQQTHMWLRPEQLRLLREEQLQIRHELRVLAEQYAEVKPRETKA